MSHLNSVMSRRANWNEGQKRQERQHHLARFGDGIMLMTGGRPASLDDTMPGCLAAEAASSADERSSVAI